jgi:hypothetical protein
MQVKEQKRAPESDALSYQTSMNYFFTTFTVEVFSPAVTFTK